MKESSFLLYTTDIVVLSWRNEILTHFSVSSFRFRYALSRCISFGHKRFRRQFCRKCRLFHLFVQWFIFVNCFKVWSRKKTVKFGSTVSLFFIFFVVVADAIHRVNSGNNWTMEKKGNSVGCKYSKWNVGYIYVWFTTNHKTMIFFSGDEDYSVWIRLRMGLEWNEAPFHFTG